MRAEIQAPGGSTPEKSQGRLDFSRRLALVGADYWSRRYPFSNSSCPSWPYVPIFFAAVCETKDAHEGQEDQRRT